MGWSSRALRRGSPLKAKQWAGPVTKSSYRELGERGGTALAEGSTKEGQGAPGHGLALPSLGLSFPSVN